MSTGSQLPTFYGISVREFLKKSGIAACLIVLSFWFWKYTLEPNAATQKALIDSAIQSTEANTESVRIMAESTIDIAKSNREMIELSKAMDRKLDLILAGS